MRQPRCFATFSTNFCGVMSPKQAHQFETLVTKQGKRFIHCVCDCIVSAVQFLLPELEPLSCHCVCCFYLTNNFHIPIFHTVLYWWTIL